MFGAVVVSGVCVRAIHFQLTCPPGPAQSPMYHFHFFIDFCCLPPTAYDLLALTVSSSWPCGLLASHGQRLNFYKNPVTRQELFCNNGAKFSAANASTLFLKLKSCVVALLLGCAEVLPRIFLYPV